MSEEISLLKMAAGVDRLQLALIIFGLIERFQTPSNFELQEHLNRDRSMVEYV
jgi:hypothetical protein